MDILVLENPKKQTGALVGSDICDYIRDECYCSAQLAENALDAHLHLKTGQYDYCIIHHYSNEEIDFLKERNKDVKYAAYGTKHATMVFNPNNNTYRDILLKRYDYFLYGASCIKKMIFEN